MSNLATTIPIRSIHSSGQWKPTFGTLVQADFGALCSQVMVKNTFHNCSTSGGEKKNLTNLTKTEGSFCQPRCTEHIPQKQKCPFFIFLSSQDVFCAKWFANVTKKSTGAMNPSFHTYRKIILQLFTKGKPVKRFSHNVTIVFCATTVCGTGFTVGFTLPQHCSSHCDGKGWCAGTAEAPTRIHESKATTQTDMNISPSLDKWACTHRTINDQSLSKLKPKNSSAHGTITRKYNNVDEWSLVTWSTARQTQLKWMT